MNTNYQLTHISQSFPDDRDFPYIPLPLTTEMKKEIDLKPDVFEIDNQGAIGSCTANASTSCCEFLLKKVGRGVSLSRLFTYWNTRNVIEDRPKGEGASLRDAIRSLYHQGICPEYFWPYDETKVNDQPDASATQEALKHKVTKYERVNIGEKYKYPTVDGMVYNIKSAINEGLPVVFAMVLGEDFYNVTGDWHTHLYKPANRTGGTNKVIGSHAMLIIGYDDVSRRFLVENSWGSGFGDGGFVGIPYETFYEDAFEAWVIREFDGVNIEQKHQDTFPKDLTVKIIDDEGKEVTDISMEYLKGSNSGWCITPNLTVVVSGGLAPYYTGWVPGFDLDQTSFYFSPSTRFRHQFTDPNQTQLDSYYGMNVWDSSPVQNVNLISHGVTMKVVDSITPPINNNKEDSNNLIYIVGGIVAVIGIIATITKLMNIW